MWWQKAVFYQIYPRSFADGNGDGMGDIAGMIQQLDYLQELGVDALWLSPHYPSPYTDCGYDVSDYCGVAPEYGSLDDFKAFLEGAHQRGMKVVLDLVLNHSSDEHPWFQESRASLDNPKRDWYVWHSGVDGGPPNNWYSGFGGLAWEFDPTTDQYYYHYFLKEQPDLNWHNPDVKQAFWEAVRFWLDLGVDGFRLDAIGTVFEHPDMQDHRSQMGQLELYRMFRAARTEAERKKLLPLWKEMFGNQVDQPGVHELMQELRSIIDEYDDRVLIGESDQIEFYGDGTNELHLAFNFPLMRTNHLTPAWILANQEDRLNALPPGAWPCNTLNNHDSTRVYSLFGDGENDPAIARLALAMLLTLKGTPFLYNGEEIGMTDLMLTEIEQFYDTPAIWMYENATDELDIPRDQLLQIVARVSRDRCRTPLQWQNAPNGGFSPPEITPWLPVNPNYAEGVNVADQRQDPNSLWNFYRIMLHLRKNTPALVAGDYQPLSAEADPYLAFLRTSLEQSCLVVLNFSTEPQPVSLEADSQVGTVLFSNMNQEGEVDLRGFTVLPFEVLIAEIG